MLPGLLLCSPGIERGLELGGKPVGLLRSSTALRFALSSVFSMSC